MSAVAEVSNATNATTTTTTTAQVVGLPPKNVTMVALRAEFPQCFTKDLVKAVAALTSRAKALEEICEIYAGFALHKAHSGIGIGDAMNKAMEGLVSYPKGNQSVPSKKTEPWFVAMNIVNKTPCKLLKASCRIAEFTDLYDRVRASLEKALITDPSLARDGARIAREKKKGLEEEDAVIQENLNTQMAERQAELLAEQKTRVVAFDAGKAVQTMSLPELDRLEKAIALRRLSLRDEAEEALL